MTCEKID